VLLVAGDMRRVDDGRQRVVIEAVSPEVDGGRFPAKRTAGDRVVVEADVFTDGHDAVAAVLLHRPESTAEWTETPMEPLVNDRWRAAFTVNEVGRYRYTLTAWVDHFASWRHGLGKKIEAGQAVAVDLLAGAGLVDAAVERATGNERRTLRIYATALRSGLPDAPERALDDELARLMRRHSARPFAVTYERELALVVDRALARFGAWYELFPRSCAETAGTYATLRDVERRLPYVASMGFDVLYLPPIHPIGRTHRKGRNNAPVASPDDPGSPWAIGAAEGGHRDVLPALGTLADFRHLVAAARSHGLEVALDIAYQCTPDHPYVARHPEWFRRRADGSVQYAENPPKKYEDIYPLDFETDRWQELWDELTDVVRFWIAQGVRIFRVDNPHTKPFAFWEYLIDTLKTEHPDVIFLSEAFTRPKVMYRLAKLGFTQSYTYFAWRNTKWELEQYFTELTQTPVREYFRPNLWPNTPDILTEYLQFGGRPAFVVRLVLAATLGASYGIYGPAFELGENRPLRPGSEEYLDSEKYELRHWDIERPDSLRELITRVNRIRRENPALQHDWSLRFHHVDNAELIAYTKQSVDGRNLVLVVVNLDAHHVQSGWVDLPLAALGMDGHEPYQVHDLLTGAHYLWHGPRNYVQLDPHTVPAHVFRVRRRTRHEQDFDYFM
jgi:starch synthase (maltosyl-transferring)